MTNENENTSLGTETEENITTTPEAPVQEKPTEPVTDIPAGEEKAEQSADDAEKLELIKKIEELEAELLKEQIKVLLLIAGVLPEKVEDAAAMAYGLCLAGRTPQNAAEEIAAAYPHLKAIRTELPQFSAESAGSKDGFSAIRRIFSAR